MDLVGKKTKQYETLFSNSLPEPLGRFNEKENNRNKRSN
jgi:hypothetical protein